MLPDHPDQLPPQRKTAAVISHCHERRTPDAEVAAVDRMAEVAPHVQDDFDLAEGQLAEVELQDREENLVRYTASVPVTRSSQQRGRALELACGHNRVEMTFAGSPCLVSPSKTDGKLRGPISDSGQPVRRAVRA